MLINSINLVSNTSIFSNPLALEYSTDKSTSCEISAFFLVFSFHSSLPLTICNDALLKEVDAGMDTSHH